MLRTKEVDSTFELGFLENSDSLSLQWDVEDHWWSLVEAFNKPETFGDI